VFRLLRHWRPPTLCAVLDLMARHSRVHPTHAQALFHAWVVCPDGAPQHWIDALEAATPDTGDVDWLRALALGALALSIPAREVLFADGHLMRDAFHAAPPANPGAIMDLIMPAFNDWSSHERAYRDHAQFVRQVFEAYVVGGP